MPRPKPATRRAKRPVRFRYRKGAAAERKTRDGLTAQGYAVQRFAGSKGLFDLMAICQAQPPKSSAEGNGHEGRGPMPPHPILLIQVKCNRLPGPEEMALLRAFYVPPGVVKCIHLWRDRAKAPEVIVL